MQQRIDLLQNEIAGFTDPAVVARRLPAPDTLSPAERARDLFYLFLFPKSEVGGNALPPW